MDKDLRISELYEKVAQLEAELLSSTIVSIGP